MEIGQEYKQTAFEKCRRLLNYLLHFERNTYMLLSREHFKWISKVEINAAHSSSLVQKFKTSSVIAVVDHPINEAIRFENNQNDSLIAYVGVNSKYAYRILRQGFKDVERD